MPFVTGRRAFLIYPLGGGEVQLEGELVYYDAKLERAILVPDGFVCDLASYPRTARIFFDRLGASARPAFVHDFIYRMQPEGISRRHADRIFRDALKEEGASWFERFASWAGVRVGGWIPWRKAKNRLQETISGGAA